MTAVYSVACQLNDDGTSTKFNINDPLSSDVEPCLDGCPAEVEEDPCLDGCPEREGKKEEEPCLDGCPSPINNGDF